jgi:hypothetical protein
LFSDLTGKVRTFNKLKANFKENNGIESPPVLGDLGGDP